VRGTLPNTSSRKRETARAAWGLAAGCSAHLRFYWAGRLAVRRDGLGMVGERPGDGALITRRAGSKFAFLAGRTVPHP